MNIDKTRKVAEKIWLNATSHGTEEPYASLSKIILAELDEAQQPAEPVAWMTEDGRLASVTGKENMPSAADRSFCIPLYTHPPQARQSLEQKWHNALRDLLAKHGAQIEGNPELLAFVNAVKDFARAPHPPQAAGLTVGVDELANIIRQVDGGNTLGAGALAEAIIAAIEAKS